MAHIDGGEMSIRVLKQHGIGEIFTLHGGHLDAIFQAELDHGMRSLSSPCRVKISPMPCCLSTRINISPPSMLAISILPRAHSSSRRRQNAHSTQSVMASLGHEWRAPRGRSSGSAKLLAPSISVAPRAA